MVRQIGLTLAVAAAAFFAATAQAANPPTSFLDPAGDSGTAPDIGGIAVSNDASGLYRFDVTLLTDYAPNAEFYLYVDSDKNSSTGDTAQSGADYLVYDDHATHEFSAYKWVNGDWADSGSSTVQFVVGPTNRTLTIAVNASDLGATQSFNFFVVADDGNSSADAGSFDDAPSGSGTFAYALQRELTLTSTSVTSLIKQGTWTIGIAVRRGDTNAFVGNEGTLTCTAKSAAGKLPVLLHAFLSVGSNAASAAVCSFKLPKKRKVPVTATITVTVEGVSVTKTAKAKT